MKLLALLSVILLEVCLSVVGDKEHLHEEHFKDGEHNADFDHDAILGSHHAAEEFGQLAPEEAKKRLSALVDRMDENKDSFVTKKELTSWVLNSFRHLDAEEATDKMLEVDEDGDSHVTWEEYLRKTYGYDAHEVKKMEGDKAEEVQTFVRMITEDEEKFKLADEDKDRKLDATEFGAFLHPHDFEHMHQFEIDRTLKDYDRNGNGLIDLGEYLGDPKKRMEHAQQALVDTENFMEYDLNGDQLLDDVEIARMTVPSQDPAAQMEAEHLIESTDTDGDGKLSKKEITDQTSLWVGSSATNYGDWESLKKYRHDEL